MRVGVNVRVRVRVCVRACVRLRVHVHEHCACVHHSRRRGQLLEGDIIKAVDGVYVDNYSVLEQIRLSRDAIGTAISFTVERRGGQSKDVVLLRQRLDSVSQAESIAGQLMEHSRLLQELGGLDENRGDPSGAGRNMRKLQSSFESIQVQFGEMQHEAWQAEHNLSTHLASLQENTQKKLAQARRLMQTAERRAKNEIPNSLGDLQEKIKSETLQKTVEGLEKDLAKSHATMRSLETNWRKSKSELETCQAICMESDLTIQELEKIQLAAVAELDWKQQEEVGKVFTRLVALEEELTESRQRNLESEKVQAQMMQSMQQENKSMQQQNAAMQQSLQKQNAVMLQNRRNTEALELQLAECGEQLERAKQTQADRYKDLEDEFYLLQKESEERCQELEGKHENVELEQQQKLAQVCASTAAEVEKSEKMRQDLALSESELSESKRHLEKMIAENNKSKELQAQLQRAMPQMQMELANRESAFSDCNGRLEKMTLMFDDSKQKITALQQQVLEVEKVRNTAEIKYNWVTEELEQVKQKMAEAEENQKSAEAQIGNAEDVARQNRQDVQEKLLAAESESKQAMQRLEDANTEVAHFKNALAMTESLASESEAELTRCKQRLTEEGQEMDVLMMEVVELQEAVIVQNKQYALVNQELARAQMRVQQHETQRQEQAAHSPGASLLRKESSLPEEQKNLQRILSWLNIDGSIDDNANAQPLVGQLPPVFSPYGQLPPTVLANLSWEGGQSETPLRT